MHPLTRIHWYDDETAFDRIDWKAVNDIYGMYFIEEYDGTSEPGDGMTYVRNGELFVIFYRDTGNHSFMEGTYIITDVRFDKYGFPKFKFEKASRRKRGS